MSWTSREKSKTLPLVTTANLIDTGNGNECRINRIARRGQIRNDKSASIYRSSASIHDPKVVVPPVTRPVSDTNPYRDETKPPRHPVCQLRAQLRAGGNPWMANEDRLFEVSRTGGIVAERVCSMRLA